VVSYEEAKMGKQSEGKGMGVAAETSRMDFGDGGESAIPAI